MVRLGSAVWFIGLKHGKGTIMQNSLRISILVCGSILLSGCAGIQGRWESTGKIRPADAGNERKSTGTYTYAWNNLVLTPDGGGATREYDVKIALIGGKMDIEHRREDQRDIHVQMKRAGCAKDCSKKCCKTS